MPQLNEAAVKAANDGPVVVVASVAAAADGAPIPTVLLHCKVARQPMS